MSIYNIYTKQNQQLEPMMEDPLSFQHKMFKLVNGGTSGLQTTQILIVGVGGIGCQILKVLCKMPIGSVHVIDMDTIQLSNLNRQFLFKKEHKGMSKALVAKETIIKINPDFNITAHHKNIKELPINFFKQFNFLIMALDNIEARNYVNKIGVRLNIPIIDAGTLGYKGNVTTIIPKQTKCYSCEPKLSQQKVFPVCTIRMRPDKPIHCIVWAKLLFEVLFGPENDDNDLKDLSQLAKNNDVLDIMHKLFESDILQIKDAKEDSDNKLSQIFAKSIKTISKEELQKHIGTASLETFNLHQNKLSEQLNISIFAQSFTRLNQQKKKDSVITFQKDDDNIIHFISSGSNLRMYCFGIERQSFNQIKNMAGNIVPAIASTNSIVSGIQVVEMMKLIQKRTEKMRTYYVQNLNTKVIGLRTQANLASCQTCHPTYTPVIISADLSKYTLRNLVDLVKDKSPSLEQFSINYGSMEYFNTDDPKQSLLQKSILQLCSAYQVDLIITNQDTMRKVCVIWMIHDEAVQQVKIENQSQLRNVQEDEKSDEIQQQKNQVGNAVVQDESDIVMFHDQASPDIQIIQVRRNVQLPKKSNQTVQSRSQLLNSEQSSQKPQAQQIQIVDDSNSNQKPSSPQIISNDAKQTQKNRHEQSVNEENGIHAEKRQLQPISPEQHDSDSIKKKVKQTDQE